MTGKAKKSSSSSGKSHARPAAAAKTAAAKKKEAAAAPRHAVAALPRHAKTRIEARPAGPARSAPTGKTAAAKVVAAPRKTAVAAKVVVAGKGTAQARPAAEAARHAPLAAPVPAAAGKRGKEKVAATAPLIIDKRAVSLPEERQSQLKLLIAQGKEQGYLTYAQVNDHLPSEIVDPEQIEDIVNTINDMGIPVYEKAPDADAMMRAEPASPADEEAIEEAAAALAALDAELGRTTDPVRMYMREMGTVELLTREGEIRIAKPRRRTSTC